MPAAEPRPEEFGITPDDLARTPAAFIAGHRPVLLVVGWCLVLAGTFAVLAALGSDPLAALVFAVLGTAAATIVLVPVMVCLLCATERAEVAIRSRRHPAFRACAAFRDALATSGGGPRPVRAPRGRTWFARAGHEAFSVEIARRLVGMGASVARASDPVADGFDLEATVDGATVLIRCLDGRAQADAGIAREMAACLHDRAADEAIVYSIRGATADFDRARRGRPIRVEHPSSLPEPPATE